MKILVLCCLCSLFPISAIPSFPGTRLNPWPRDTGGRQNVFRSNRVREIHNELWVLRAHSVKRLLSVFAYEKYLFIRIRRTWWPAMSVVCAEQGIPEIGKQKEEGELKGEPKGELRCSLCSPPDQPLKIVLRLMQGLGSDCKVHRKKLPFALLFGTIVGHRLWWAIRLAVLQFPKLRHKQWVNATLLLSGLVGIQEQKSCFPLELSKEN